VHHSDQLYDLAMLNPVAYDYWPVQPITAVRTPIIRQFMMSMLDLGSLKQIVRRGLYNRDRADDELMIYFQKTFQDPLRRKAFLHFAKCLNNQHLMEIATDLRALQLPVMIIRGEADLYLSSAITDKLSREIPNSQLVKMKTAGHFLQEDEPEAVVKILIEFFANNANDRSS
jgi:pimeloyl-ACP methyl ester carboxylesterase